jgi:hypothetical protein
MLKKGSRKGNTQTSCLVGEGLQNVEIDFDEENSLIAVARAELETFEFKFRWRKMSRGRSCQEVKFKLDEVLTVQVRGRCCGSDR